MIPLYAPARNAIDDFQNGRWGWGAFHTVMAVSDLFMLKSLATAATKATVAAVGQAAVKEGGRVFWAGGNSNDSSSRICSSKWDENSGNDKGCQNLTKLTQGMA